MYIVLLVFFASNRHVRCLSGQARDVCFHFRIGRHRSGKLLQTVANCPNITTTTGHPRLFRDQNLTDCPLARAQREALNVPTNCPEADIIARCIGSPDLPTVVCRAHSSLQ